MAPGWVLLGAEQGNREPAHATLKACDAFLECWRLSNLPVQDMPRGVVELGTLGTATELATEVEIAKASPFHGFSEGLEVKLRSKA